MAKMWISGTIVTALFSGALLAGCSSSQTLGTQGAPLISTSASHQMQSQRGSHRIRPDDAYDAVVTYAQGIGFPNAQHYGNDGSGNPVGMTFGMYTGTMNHPYTAVLSYASNHGFPNAQFYGDDGSGNPVGLYYQ